MVRRVVTLAVALALGATAARPAEAGAVTFTGNVETDMPIVSGNGVYAVPGLQPGQVAQDAWISGNNWINGWVVKDLRFDYNKSTDTMQVGVNFYSIAGDADGNPSGKPAPQTLAEGGQDPASLGGRKSITVEFAAPSADGSSVGSPVIVAGVPQNKTQDGTGTDGFNVAIAGTNPSIQANYGPSIPWANGNLAFDPSPAHPGFEFSIKDWSAFKNLAGGNGFWVSAYAGSPDDVVAGESNLGWIRIPGQGTPAAAGSPAAGDDATAVPVGHAECPRADHPRRLGRHGRGRGLGPPPQAEAGDHLKTPTDRVALERIRLDTGRRPGRRPPPSGRRLKRGRIPEMIRRKVMTWAAALALGAASGSIARAGAVTFTGNVEADMPSDAPATASLSSPASSRVAVAQDGWITQSGWTNGWVMKDMRLDYNQATDTMQVGVNFYSIAGSADGNPSGKPDPRTIAAGGSDPASLGGRKSISVEFAAPSTTNPNQLGTPTVVAGVPENKTAAGTGTDGFNVAIAGGNPMIQSNYGPSIPWANGNLAFDPSPAHPDFEFAIKDWSKFQSLAGKNGFWVSAFAGSPDDVVAGEGMIPWVHIPTLAQQVVVPEPTTVAGWAVMTLGAAWALRRSRRATNQA